MKVRGEPCSSCPYRRDVPSGVWAAEEYDKLEAYDRPTGDQPVATFQCHATPDHYCHGWAVVHSNRGHACDLLSLRLARLTGFDGDIPEPAVPLFASGTEAAEHGRQEIEQPSEKAKATMEKLVRKYPRIAAHAKVSA